MLTPQRPRIQRPAPPGPPVPSAPPALAAHPAAEEEGRLCSICQTGIKAGEPVGPCPACAALFHEECWNENGGCAVYGCAHMPQTVKDAAGPPRAMAFWGKEEKDCPYCRRKIKVAAVRCRHCGATFESAEPISATEVRRKEKEKGPLESAKQTSVVLFVAGIVPCLAPLALVFGSLWFLKKQELIKKLPGTNRVFCYVGLIGALVSTIMLALAIILV